MALTTNWSVAPSKKRCFVCAAQTETYRARLAFGGGYSRCFVNCPRCGIIHDHKSLSDAAAFSFDGQVIRLSKEYECQAAVLSIESDWRHERIIMDWPMIDQKLQQELRVPAELAAGFHYFTIFKSSGLELEVSRMPFNIDRP